MLPGSAAPIDLKSDTWTAADALGRKLPGMKECGPPRDGKFVGIFYFLWSGQHGTGGPYDITKIVAENPANPKWGPEQAFHHWGESELGYYLSDDPYVIRKHARMLSQAGVDTLFFDVTNGITYLPVVLKLCDVYTQMRTAGEPTPQISFLARSASDVVVTSLYDNFYNKNLYPELWFRWKGKPLILSGPCEIRPEIREFFNFRESWAWTSPDGWFGDGKDKWPWLDYYPQVPGWHEEGVPEEVAVSVAQHPTTTIGRSYHNGSEPAPANQHPAQGLYFAEQWKGALAIDPEFIFITGWNEWVAQRFLAQQETEGFAGRTLAKGDTYFVDAYSQEYSRDIEPMKGGHTDNYYYQMIDGIRRFKGVRAVEPASKPKTIRIDGGFRDWADVRPEFMDVTGDTEHRKTKGWGSAGTYINNTGRNDFTRLKVARDAKNLYFYAETKKNLTSFTDANWMLLFIDADCNPSTGWNGYDYLVNNSVIDAKNTTLSKWTQNGWERTGTIQYSSVGNKLEIRVPKSALGFAGKPVTLDLHWADNIRTTSDIIEFAVSGDSAPDRRFNYRYMAD
ncbi:MAG: glycoside hydrolase family 71/99 protein [Armatimonadota bacterium]